MTKTEKDRILEAWTHLDNAIFDVAEARLADNPIELEAALNKLSEARQKCRSEFVDIFRGVRG